MAYTKEPVAIIGSACRLPGGSSSPSKLWNLLCNPRNVLSDFPSDRLNLSSFHSTNGEDHGSTVVNNESYILSEDPRLFDASFFSINPREADGMDPQQRLLLETCYEALESAGCTLEQIQGTMTSVFVGSMTNDYYDIQFRDTETMPTYTITGTARSFLSNRISYFFDLKGESMTIDTACSSSLVALHQAVQSLRSGQSTTSIVAGANILLDPGTYIGESKLHMLSPDAQSKMWDESANGYARGEGVSAIFLKPLSQALKDGDHIECLVRETSVNSDGRTKGITMPSATAQAALIRGTYQSAGLDPSIDRCHYFECHGTGTSAGDPQEAQAIQETFFPGDKPEHSTNDKLYVGSIKTIVGHTEGCAGLAGVIKASLAIQHRFIPPNMHFKDLNPAITPFYDHLLVATDLTPWPSLVGTPARASVNSFGLGGTNAHAILESYDPDPCKVSPILHLGETSLEQRFIGPLIFSAKTKSSLDATIKDFASYIKSNPSLDLTALTYVLQKKRNSYRIKHYFVGATRQQLVDAMENYIEVSNASSEKPTPKVYSSKMDETPGILGIFTGQGAQWASMGRQLMLRCRSFRESIEMCERSLACLKDGPQWSLKEELMAEKAASRVSEAEISQTLCTAIQIAMVDLLSAAGIKLDAVVGHSSGEIAATYAAGIISARDGIRIAYYRGYHARLARGTDGKSGAMIAVGMSLDNALSFCARPTLSGRVSVAASNAPAVVTLSGDVDAIHEAKELCDREKTFARLLNVDTAYHSHHMIPCAGPYLDSLRACNIKTSAPRADCCWISSVRGDVDLLEGDLQSLTGPYWVENMVNPVLFSQAVECSLWNGGPFDMVVELGPHPALKGPTAQTIHAATGSTLPYAASLRRGADDVEAFSDAVGYVWSYLGRSFVDFDGFRRTFEDANSPAPKLLKNLPSYAWDHDKIHWIESRVSRNYRLGNEPSHELLGRRLPEDSTNEMRWRNVLKLDELPWLCGHEFQGQVLFPAAGYVAMAIEVSKNIAKNRPIKFIELRDYAILQPLVLEENSLGVETIFTVRISNDTVLAQQEAMVEAEFDCCACSDTLKGSLAKKCVGVLLVHLGDASMADLPPRVQGPSDVLPMDMERFDSSLVDIGLNYQGLFKGLKSVKRTLGYATGCALWSEADLGHKYTIHPAFLDSSFQALFAAFYSPATEGLWTTFLPVDIQRIIVNPNACYNCRVDEIKFDVDAFITGSSFDSFQGDLHLFDTRGHTGVQIEGLRMKSISEPQAADDRLLFAHNVWEADIFSAIEDFDETQDADESDLVDVIERTALYYYQAALDSFPQKEVTTVHWYHQRMFKAVGVSLNSVRDGDHPVMKAEWLDDSRELILTLQSQFPGQVDLELLNTIGENLVPALRGEFQLPEDVSGHNMIDRLYTEGLGFAYLKSYIARVLKKLTFKYPQAKILEIGAGAGGTTGIVLDALGDTYSSYTYTDASSKTFVMARDKFAGHSKVVYEVLDIEKDISSQGLEKYSYDMIIAFNVLYATSSLSETLQHTRDLIKPGGYLILMEVTGDLLRIPFLMGGLHGWWNGATEGRQFGPGISPLRWDKLLQANGFSGVDKIVHDAPDPTRHSCSVILTQAVDERFDLIRDPLSSIDSIPMIERITIIGGTTLPISKLSRDIEKLFYPWKRQITIVTDIDHLNEKHLASRTSVISLTELDRPLFTDPLTPARLGRLQDLLSQASNVLWVTSGRLSEEPTSNMTVGIGRALMTELPQINMQFIDIRQTTAPTPRKIGEAFLRLVLPTLPKFTNCDMLWTTEPELVFDGDEMLIPRVVPDKMKNERLNSIRRLITKDMRTDNVPVHVSPSKGSLILQTGYMSGYEHASEHIGINTIYSTALPSKEQEPCHLLVGTVPKTNEIVYVLSQAHASSTEVPSNEAFVLELKDQSCGPDILQAMASQLVIDALLPRMPDGGSILFYEPDDTTAKAVAADRRWQSRQCHFASSREGKLPDTWIPIHPQASERAVKDVLPNDLTAIVDFSNSQHGNCRASFINSKCSVHYFEPSLLEADRRTILSAAYAAVNARKDLGLGLPHPNVTSAQSLVGASTSAKLHPAVVDWTQSTQLSVAIRPVEFLGLFSPVKTYFLVGLTGKMGLSICRWMIGRGARYIALASRNAQVNTIWLNEMQKLGATIHVYKMDVTKKDSIDAVHATISKTMPPIKGVCNAAMLLSDKLFVDMSVDDMAQTLKPKVNGSKNLDEVFSQPSLDFFILFSSTASVLGNAGQSNYHAANLFMTSLATHRRAKGLAASVMCISMTAEVGYVQRTGRRLEDHLRKQFLLPLSESDIHHLFAEAVLASPAASKQNPEVIMGIKSFAGAADADNRPPWYTNPRLSHFVTKENMSENQRQTTSSTLTILQQMESANSEDSATAKLQESFSLKLANMMQLGSNKIHANVSLLELGCDSLLALEIRSWFLKEVNVDIPVFKVLGGDTLAEICRGAVRKVMASRPEVSLETTSAKDSVEAINVEDPSSNSNGDQPDESDGSQNYDADTDLNTASITPASTPSSPKSGSLSHLDLKLEPLRYEEFKRVEKLSYAQSRMWFLGNYMNDLTACNVTLSYNISGVLQTLRFQRALATVVSHHESLYTCLFSKSDGGELMQGAKTAPADLLRHVQSSDKAKIKREFEDMSNTIWDLEQGQCFGATLVTQSPNLHTIIFGYHHIVMDGLSWFLFLQDLDRAYRMMPLEAVKTQYMDYAREQHYSIEKDEYEDQISFWRNEYSQIPEPLPLLAFARVKGRKSIENYNCHTVSTTISKDLATKIKVASQTSRATEFHFHLTIIQVLLSRLLDVEDVCIGITDANRDEKLANTIGFFLNLLPLRFHVDKSDHFSDILRQTSEKVFLALSNSKVPFDLLLDKLNVPRSSSHSPLFQVALNYRMGDMWQTSLGDCQLNLDSYDDAKGQYDLSFSVTRTSDGTSLLEITSLDYLYSPESSKLLLDIYVHLLETFSADTFTQVRENPLFDPAKTKQASGIGRGPRITHELSKTLSERFDIVQRKYPEEIAVTDGSEVSSYAQLAQKVNDIATALMESGLPPGSRIGVICQPSVGTIACMLAVLRIGCVYVPFDLSLPRTRHAAVFATCKPRMMLCQPTELESAIGLSGGQASVMDISQLPKTGSKAVNCIAHPDSPAFLLCTSGSTGTPKGIVLSQAGFTNFLSSMADLLPQQGKAVVLQQSSYGFDMSIAQTFLALAFGNGGTLAVVPNSARGDPVEISKLMLKEKVTLTLATPSEYLMILRYGKDYLGQYSSWRHVCTGGESVTDQLKLELRRTEQHQLILTDFYGPTEISAATSMGTLSLALDESHSNDEYPSVGKAIANTSIYIVDEECKPVPVGFPGEICVGGAGVAIGYLDMPDLNKSKFLSDPFASPEDITKGWTRMYKTGDRGRLNEDGSLIFMGRNGSDTQIKLRGLRIELDDVANNLLQTAAGLLSDAVVSVRGDPHFLVAHVVIAPGRSASDEEVQLLGQNLPLPQYMCPTMTIILDRLPTNHNGKTDRRAIERLPLPALQSVPQKQKPLTLSQGELKLVWREILQEAALAPNITTASDFFMIGGSSLLLVRLQGAIKEKIGVSLQLRDLYGASTLAKMASLIASIKSQQPLQEESIEWETETAVAQSVHSATRQDQLHNPFKKSSLQVILTGSTSFLGSTVLNLLLKDRTIQKIHCLAISPEAQKALPESDKIVPHTGSLLEKSLGLAGEPYAKLQSCIDLIIHCGSNGHCLNNYFSLKVPNLESTRFLTELALPRLIPIHYISSNRVTLLSGSATLPPVSVAKHPPATDGSEGFTASKWASECFLENMAQATGLPVGVHRACALIGDQAPSEDALNALIKFSISMRAVPRFDNFAGFFDFKDVVAVAAEIMSDVMTTMKQEESPGAGVGSEEIPSLKFRHHSCGEQIPVQDFGKHMGRLHGFPFEEIPLEEWLVRATELGIEDLIVSYLRAGVSRGDTISFPFLGTPLETGS